MLALRAVTNRFFVAKLSYDFSFLQFPKSVIGFSQIMCIEEAVPYE